MRCIWTASARSISHIFRVNPTRCTRSAHSAAVEIAQTPPSRALSELTDAQTSRAASSVVRHFCSTGEFRNAYFIVNSLRSTSPSSTTFSRSIPSDTLHNVLNDRDALDFGGRNISPRLACHSLLHGLVRQGLFKKAGRLAEMMMEDGISIRSSTLQAVIQSLALTPTPSTMTHVRGHFNVARPNNVLQLNFSQAGNPYLQFATQLLVHARMYRQRRTKDMFDTLIRACILQGEIIVGSLLLVLAVKDWQLRTLRKDIIDGQVSTQVDNSDVPYPPQAAMYHLLRSIEDGVLSGDERTRLSCTQSLANVASLLEDQSLPFSQIAPLLRLLTRYSRTSYDVWILPPFPDTDPPLRINAPDYFDCVLVHTAKNLPNDHHRKRRKRRDREWNLGWILPPMDLHAYNTILHFTLQYRRDVPLARGILRHMKFEGREPDVATRTIVQRAEMTHQRPLGLIRTESEETPSLSLHSPTFASDLALVREAGHPDVIGALLSHLIPELSIIPHPSSPDSPPSKHLSRAAALRRAVALGPSFFTALLNALRKAGRTGLAERVWFLAQEAERASWCDGKTGWCLPIHAYTSMIQCYANETRRLRSFSPSWDEHVRRDVRNKRYIKGWAKYLLVRKRILGEGMGKRETAQRLATELDKYMKHGATHIFYSMMRTQTPPSSTSPSTIRIPRPDARFFNALLSMFAKPPRCYKRRPPSHYRRHLRVAETYYTRFWMTSAYWHPFLRELADAMLRSGYEVPLGLRYLFMGRYMPATKEFHHEQGRSKPFKLEESSRGRGRPRNARQKQSRTVQQLQLV